MQFTIGQFELIQPLSNLLRNTSTVQSYVQIEKVNDNEIKLTSSNGSIILQYKLLAKIVAGEPVMVNAREFFDIVSKLDGIIDFNDGLIKNGKRKIKIGVINECHYKLDEITKEAKTIDLTDFKSVIKNRLFACAKGEFQQILQCLCINNNEVCATDGNILSIGHFKTDLGELLINQNLANEIIKCFDCNEINLIDDTNKIIFYTDTIKLIGYKVSGLYPKYQQLIPHYDMKPITLNKNEIINNLELMLIVANKTAPTVIFNFENNKLTLKERNEASTADVEVSYDLEPFEIAFNINYLISILKNCTGDGVEMQFNDSLGACVIKTDSDWNLIMPVKIS